MTPAVPQPAAQPSPDDYGLVLTTAASEAEAQTLAQALVTQQLAACVNFFPIHSVYTWQGTVESSPEWQLYIKTRRSHFPAIQTLFTAIHSYEVPELILIPLTAASSPYLHWMAAQTQAAPASTGPD
ncbi:MAG: divalent-cation tolerance protein CutA [Prochlorothrix sp.]|nr:divalent-cation tolerance protein CutA [Prochlorothrix sp.]